MHDTGLIGAAVANNAAWCDAVCRSHGYPGTFSSSLWISTRHQLRFYPNAVTLRPEVTEPEVLAAVAASGPFAVKDSFARGDLAPAGFRLLAEATWIARDGPPTETAEAATAEYGMAEDGFTWDQVTAPNELSEWDKGLGRR